MKLNFWIGFLISALSGSIFAFLVLNDRFPFLSIILCGIGLTPFLWCSLQKNLKLRLLAFLGFSFPIILYVGEGIWFSTRYFYQISLIPAIFIYLVWAWFLGSVHWLIFSLFVRKIAGENFQKLWIIPFFWVALEFLYGQISIQARNVLIGIFPPFFALSTWTARVGGVYAISFGIVFLNALVLGCFISKVRVWRQPGWLIPLGFIFLSIMASAIYPAKKENLKEPLSLALLQPNLQFGFTESSADIQYRLDQLLMMTREALSKEVDLIVWPASLFVIGSENQIQSFLRVLESDSSKLTKVQIGLTCAVVRSGKNFYQSRVYLADLNANVKNVYVKQRLTPYTEYIPFNFLDLIGKKRLGFPEYISSKNTDLVLSSEGRYWSTPICLEIFYPELLRKFIQKGAEFLTHLSNDDVYGMSHFKKFLLKITALRALELGIPIFREAIDGASAFIDAQGRVVQSLPSGQRGILYAKLNQKGSPTLYAKIGDLFSWLCVICVIFLKLGSLLRRSSS